MYTTRRLVSSNLAHTCVDTCPHYLSHLKVQKMTFFLRAKCKSSACISPPRSKYQRASTFRILRIVRGRCDAASAWPQIRKTVHPLDFRMRFTCLSRVLLAFNFLAQNSALLFGRVACVGQPCQKQPSTNIAIFFFGKAKSGLPSMGYWRRQPIMPYSRNNATSTSSVLLFPFPRTRDINSDRLVLEKTSATFSVLFIVADVAKRN